LFPDGGRETVYRQNLSTNLILWDHSK